MRRGPVREPGPLVIACPRGGFRPPNGVLGQPHAADLLVGEESMTQGRGGSTQALIPRR